MENADEKKTKYQSMTHEQLVALVEKLEHQLEHQNRMLQFYLFSSKKERHKADPEGMRPLFNEIEATSEEEGEAEPEATTEEEPETTKVGEHTRKKRRGGRAPLPANLPRERREFDLNEQEKICAVHGVTKKRIGETVTEQLSVIPAQIKVIENVTFTYKCPCCDAAGEASIVKSKKDPEPIPKSIASADLLAYIATAKYEDALPLYRQEKIFNRHGIDLNRTSMARWMIQGSELARPLINLMSEELLQGPVLQSDETPVQVLAEANRAPETKSYMWVMARAYDAPLLVFSYYETRSKNAAKDFLADFKGILVCDGLKTYDSLAKQQGFSLAGCMAHCRRKFFHAEKEEKRLAKPGTKLSASLALAFIRQLYKIERDLRGKAPDEIKNQRQAKSVPLLEQFYTWLRQQETMTLAHSSLGKAIGYALDQWPKLTQYCNHGLVPIDNNYTESHIRPFVIGRNNWMFAATPKGAEASATLYSLIESAKANRVNPYEYLRLIFKELPKAQSIEDFEKLLPHKVQSHFSLPFYLPP